MAACHVGEPAVAPLKIFFKRDEKVRTVRPEVRQKTQYRQIDDLVGTEDRQRLTAIVASDLGSGNTGVQGANAHHDLHLPPPAAG